jgi:hypothetical protein
MINISVELLTNLYPPLSFCPFSKSTTSVIFICMTYFRNGRNDFRVIFSQNKWKKKLDFIFYKRYVWYLLTFSIYSLIKLLNNKQIITQVVNTMTILLIGVKSCIWSCTGSIWAVKLHWLDNLLLYTVADQDIVFLLPDSC